MTTTPASQPSLKSRAKYLKYLLYTLFTERRKPGACYGQRSEDKVAELLLGKVGSFIDIGANDGYLYSNTYRFAKQGASGLCFEPVRKLFHLLCFFNCLHRKVRCINEGISDIARKERLYVDGAYSRLDTDSAKFSPAVTASADRWQEVVLHPLEYWLKRYPKFRSVDLVTIDVEGHELEVLKGIDLSRFVTRCFIIETDDCHGERLESMMSLLALHGYRPVIANDINTFWLRDPLPSDEIVANICETYEHYVRVK